MTLYEALVQAGVELDNHESDLYCEVTETSRRLVQSYSVHAQMFMNQVDRSLWYVIPFMYDPWWGAHK
jgi:hypothetical protein